MQTEFFGYIDTLKAIALILHAVSIVIALGIAVCVGGFDGVFLFLASLVWPIFCFAWFVLALIFFVMAFDNRGKDVACSLGGCLCSIAMFSLGWFIVKYGEYMCNRAQFGEIIKWGRW
jgi:hypothetical protein